MTAPKNRGRSRSRSRSPRKNSGWGENRGKVRSRSRSRSIERFDGAASTRRSFHESIMDRARSSPSKSARPNTKDYRSLDDLQNHHNEKSRSAPDVDKKETVAWGRSSPRQLGNDEVAHGLNSNYKEEENGKQSGEKGLLTREDNGY